MDRKKSIALLNKAVADELHAVHQYMFFHFHLDDMGYKPMAQLFKITAIEEMVHIELLAERILFLKGEVELVAADPVAKITDARKMLEKAADMEDRSAADYNRFSQEAAANRDSATKQLFERLVNDEERHFDQYDKQVDNIKRFGEQYLALQSYGGPGGGSVPGPAGQATEP
jgi:bacterioferritin